MAAQTEDKKLDGAGLSVLWGLIKNIIPTVPTNVSSFTNDAAYVSLLDTHNANLVLASPNGASGLPSFRALAASDIPDLSGTYLTSASLNGYATQSWVTSQGFGTVSSIKVGTTSYSPSSGVVSLPAYPTTLPASDVYSWAKASSKPSYTYTEVGAASSGHTHSTSIGTSTGTNQITLAFGTKYAITAGGTSYVFTMPSNPDTWRPLGTGASDACAGNDSRLSNSRPASDVYSWAKASSKPSYSWSEIGSRPTKLSQFTNDSGFVTSSGVTSVATGTGLTGGTITGTGTISINSTYQTYISHGNTAYGWGNHANGGYLKTSGGTMTGSLYVKGSSTSYYFELGVYSNINRPFLRDYCNGTARDVIAISSEDQLYIGTYDRMTNIVGGNVKLYGKSSSGSGYTTGFSVITSGNCRVWNKMFITSSSPTDAMKQSSHVLYANGSIGATAFSNVSDMRNKDFLSNISLNVESIAYAPIFRYKWKDSDDLKIYAGTSAQYWQTVLPENVFESGDNTHTLSMQYDAIALISAVTIAKEVVNDKERIRQLEQRVSQLEAQLAN